MMDRKIPLQLDNSSICILEWVYIEKYFQTYYRNIIACIRVKLMHTIIALFNSSREFIYSQSIRIEIEYYILGLRKYFRRLF